MIRYFVPVTGRALQSQGRLLGLDDLVEVHHIRLALVDGGLNLLHPPVPLVGRLGAEDVGVVLGLHHLTGGVGLAPLDPNVALGGRVDLEAAALAVPVANSFHL